MFRLYGLFFSLCFKDIKLPFLKRNQVQEVKLSAGITSVVNHLVTSSASSFCSSTLWSLWKSTRC